AASHQELIALRRRRVELLDAFERRLPAELENDVALRPRDRERLPDRPATLRDDSGRAVGSFEDRADRTLGEDLVVRDESRAARDDPARCHAADDGQTGRVLVQMIEKKVRRERVRIRQHDQHATGGTRRYLLEAVENAVLLFLGVGEREGSDPDSRWRRGPRRNSRLVLDLASAADDPTGCAAEQRSSTEAGRRAFD